VTEWITSSVPYLSPGGDSAPDPWAQEAAAFGRVGAHRLIDAGPRTPPERIGRLLGIEPQAHAVLRRRLVTLDATPVEVADAWYPAEIADGTRLAEPRAIKGGATRALADLGFVAVRHVEEVAVVKVPEPLREFLADTPVLELTRVSYTATGIPFEAAVMYMSPEMAPGVPRRLRYELRTAE
jgi:GntR family transcriptional regulator